MARGQFTFYGSFASALARIKKKADRADAYDAICNYALYGAEPDLERLSDAAAIAFELIRPNLDASRRKAESGRRGAEARQSADRREAAGWQTGGNGVANAEQTADERETEVETEEETEEETEVEEENECSLSPFSGGEGAAAEALSDYLRRIDPAAGREAQEELAAYAKRMGEAVCRRAFDIALENQKAVWPYIRAILRDKQARGVRGLADWDALERRAGDRRSGERRSVPTAREGKAGRADMERLRRVLARTRDAEGEWAGPDPPGRGGNPSERRS